MVNKVTIVITGASSGIGKETAIQLARMGHRVFACARNIKAMQELEQYGIEPVYMDITSDASVCQGIDLIMTKVMTIDVLINNAGYGEYGMIEEVSIDDAKRQFDVNLFGVARVNQAVLPIMRKHRKGRVIMVSSMASHIATLGSGWYSASKHALRAMAQALRMEVKDLGIDVIEIEPGPVNTGFDRISRKSFVERKHYRDYQPLIEGYLRYSKKLFRRVPGPSSTVKALVHAALNERPRYCYKTTRSSRWLPRLKAFLGNRFYTGIVMKMFKHQIF